MGFDQQGCGGGVHQALEVHIVPPHASDAQHEEENLLFALLGSSLVWPSFPLLFLEQKCLICVIYNFIFLLYFYHC